LDYAEWVQDRPKFKKAYSSLILKDSDCSRSDFEECVAKIRRQIEKLFEEESKDKNKTNASSGSEAEEISKV
jgi:hypothetical protein